MAYRASSDRALFITTSLLTIFGLVMVYSASSTIASMKYGISTYFFLRQLAYAGLGSLFMVFLINVDYHVWQREKWIRRLLVLAVICLVLVFTQPQINGAGAGFATAHSRSSLPKRRSSSCSSSWRRSWTGTNPWCAGSTSGS